MGGCHGKISSVGVYSGGGSRSSAADGCLGCCSCGGECIRSVVTDDATKSGLYSHSDRQITLPPLIEDEEGRQLVAATLQKSRERYRMFRERLSNEISHNKGSPRTDDCTLTIVLVSLSCFSVSVLPKPIRERLVVELSKRLDIDIEEAITSPKLKLQLSPADLDSSLLELYEKMIESPGGDLLRLIGGGGAVAMQNLYLRRQVEKERVKNGWLPDVFPSLVDEADDDVMGDGPLQRIRWAMRKNIPPSSTGSTGNHRGPFTLSQANKRPVSDKDTRLKMSSSLPVPMYVGHSLSHSRVPSRRGSMRMSLLI